MRSTAVPIPALQQIIMGSGGAMQDWPKTTETTRSTGVTRWMTDAMYSTNDVAPSSIVRASPILHTTYGAKNTPVATETHVIAREAAPICAGSNDVNRLASPLSAEHSTKRDVNTYRSARMGAPAPDDTLLRSKSAFVRHDCR